MDDILKPSYIAFVFFYKSSLSDFNFFQDFSTHRNSSHEELKENYKKLQVYIYI